MVGGKLTPHFPQKKHLFRHLDLSLILAMKTILYVLDESFGRQEETFKRTTRAVALALVLHDANTIGSHTVCNIEVLDKDAPLELAARSAPNGIEASVKKSFEHTSSCVLLQEYELFYQLHHCINGALLS